MVARRPAPRRPARRTAGGALPWAKIGKIFLGAINGGISAAGSGVTLAGGKRKALPRRR